MKESKANKAIFYAILSALLYGLSSPISKLLLEEISPIFMAALLYLGAGIGMLILNIYKTVNSKKTIEAKLSVKELPFVIGMIVLDIAAPILLMVGLTMTNASTVSLLNNFEIVATSIIAIIFFKEAVEKRLWIAIILISFASIFLSVENIGNFTISFGSVLVILATIFWGFENNFTRMISLKDPVQVVVIKGLGSGLGSLIIAMAMKEISGSLLYIVLALILGVFAYGFSIYFYVSAQRDLGASKTSTFFAMAPFIGVITSWIILNEQLSFLFYVGLVLMILGTYFAVTEKHKHNHMHVYVKHSHRHNHKDGHHNHGDDLEGAEHSHLHVHEAHEHSHEHSQDMHHRHAH